MSRATKDREQADAMLMVRAQADDADAFAELYERHSARAFRVACAVCGDVGRAEDAVREGFLALWRCRRSYRAGTGSFQAWSMQIIRQKAIDSGSDSSREELVAHTEHKEMIASLPRLSGDQAEVIVLAFYGGLSHSEIATQLGLPPGIVKGRMRLGLAKLRREMGDPEPTPAPRELWIGPNTG